MHRFRACAERWKLSDRLLPRTYAAAGLVNWPLAAVFVGAGVLGGLAGARAGRVLSRHRGALTRIFVGLIFLAAGYMLAHSLGIPH